jgi:predicted XRE-type DNA-binding protein
MTTTTNTPREIPPGIADTVHVARTTEQHGRDLLGEAAGMLRVAAKILTEQGWKQHEIADALGVSKQRVSQLVNPPAKKPAGKA